MTTPPNSRDRGFTLVELLVVVIIVGILAAIAIPVFLNQRKKAVDAATKSDMRNLISEVNEAMVVRDDGDLWRAFIRGGFNPNTNSPAPGQVYMLGSDTGSSTWELLDTKIDDDSFFYGTYYGRSWRNPGWEEYAGLCLTGLNRGGTEPWDGSTWTGPYSRSVNYDSESGWSRGRSTRCQSIS